MIAIAGATGNVGGKITEILIDEGHKVLCIARHADRLIPMTDRGAGAAAISLAQTDLLTEAFYGAQAVFAMIPPNYGAPDFLAYQDMIGESLCQAIEQAGVTHVVNLSSVGADLPDRTGPIRGLHGQEQRLNALSGVHVLHLRPAHFMENLLMNVDLIKTQGIMGSPLRPDLRIPMIATRDIAEAAARYLSEGDFTGKSVVELLGPRDLSMAEAAVIIGRNLDRPDLNYVQFTYQDTEKALIEMGFSTNAAGLFIEMERAFNEGLIQTVRTGENTTVTPLEEFAHVFRSLIPG